MGRINVTYSIFAELQSSNKDLLQCVCVCLYFQVLLCLHAACMSLFLLAVVLLLNVLFMVSFCCSFACCPLACCLLAALCLFTSFGLPCCPLLVYLFWTSLLPFAYLPLLDHAPRPKIFKRSLAFYLSVSVSLCLASWCCLGVVF